MGRFLSRQRLLPQLALAASNGASAELIDRGHRLCERLDDFFRDYRPAASLLHGDLWGGNWGAAANGEPVLFDPAVYFGDREADLAMTRLFGGFVRRSTRPIKRRGRWTPAPRRESRSTTCITC